MKYTKILENLKAALAVRILSQKSFRKRIGDILGVSVSMVSRKLSGETHFTAEEISILCEHFHIPVHEVFNEDRESIWQPLHLALYDLDVNVDENLEIFNWTVEMLSFGAQSDYSTFYISCNTLPDVLNPVFTELARFSGLQWLLLNKGTEAMVPLSEGIYVHETKQIMDRYISAVYSLKRSVYLINYNILENYIMDIRKFYISGYITQDDIQRMVEELENVLELFEKVCLHGRLENGKEIEIYCTHNFLPSDMYVLESEKINFGIFHPTPLNAIITKSSELCHTMMKWFNVWRCSSILISQSGTLVRQEFMEVQHDVLKRFKAEIADA